jgi:hypothetical protein
MRRVLAIALVLLPALPAFAAARTLALATMVRRDPTQLRTGEETLTVKAAKNAKLSRWNGDAARTFVPVPSRLNAAGTNRLFTVTEGSYYVSPSGAGFTVTE